MAGSLAAGGAASGDASKPWCPQSAAQSSAWPHLFLPCLASIYTRLPRRYEVQGEYTVPPNTRLPATAAELARQQQEGAVPKGRWRVQVGRVGRLCAVGGMGGGALACHDLFAECMLTGRPAQLGHTAAV